MIKDSRNPNILVCSDEYPPKVWGGMSRSVESLVHGLLMHACTVDVLTHRRKTVQKSDSCILAIDYRSSYRVIWCRYPIPEPKEISKHVNFDEYQIVYINGRGFASIVPYIKKHFSCVVVYGSRSNYYLEVFWRSLQFEQEKAKSQDGLVTLADRVVCASKSEAETLSSAYALSKDKVRVVANAVHPRFLEQEFERRLPLSRTVLFVGRFVRQKGIKFLLEAIPKVLDAHGDARFVFVGGHGTCDVKEGVLTMVQKFPENAEIKNWVSLDELVGLYTKAGVVVIPSLYEPFGNVALEAMACACTVVASRVGGLKEIIIDKKQGLLVPAGNAEAIAKAIIRAIENPIWSINLGEAARKKVQREYNPYVVAADLLEAFDL